MFICAYVYNYIWYVCAYIYDIDIYLQIYTMLYVIYMYIYIYHPQDVRSDNSTGLQIPTNLTFSTQKNQVQPCRVFIWISPKQNKQFLCKDGAFGIYIQKNNTTCFCLNQFRPVFHVWSRGHQIRSGQIMDVTSISWRYRSGLKDPVVCGEATT